MPVKLDTLKATQLSAKLAHAWKRLRTFELEVRIGLPVGEGCRYNDAEHVGREYGAILLYLRGIEDELAVAVSEAAPDCDAENRAAEEIEL